MLEGGHVLLTYPYTGCAAKTENGDQPGRPCVNISW